MRRRALAAAYAWAIDPALTAAARRDGRPPRTAFSGGSQHEAAASGYNWLGAVASCPGFGAAGNRDER